MPPFFGNCPIFARSNEEFSNFLDEYLKLAFFGERAKITNGGLSSFIKTKEGNMHFRLKFIKNKINFKVVFKDGRVLRGNYVNREDFYYIKIKDEIEKKEIIKVFDKKGFQAFERSMFEKVSYNLDKNGKKSF